MSERALRVAVVGCGNISGPYGETMGAYPTVRIAGATDVDPSLSAAFVDRFGGVIYPSLDDVLGDPDVDAIVNLTFPAAHADVTTAALNAGKHVHSEKPLAANYAAARSLVELAEQRELRLSCSPITFLGDAQQAAWRLVETGAIGRVRVAYAEVNGGRIEGWHPRPEPFYRIGPFADIGVYPLTILTAMFGPARRVTAFARTVHADRTTTSGEPFTPETPDFGVAVVELESGTIARLTANFYVPRLSTNNGIEFHGDSGSVHLSDWQDFDAAVEIARYGEPYAAVPVQGAFRGIDWGRALGDLSDAIGSGRPHRATGAHAAHIVEILDAITTSVAEGRAVDITSSFVRPMLGSNGAGPT